MRTMILALLLITAELTAESQVLSWRLLPNSPGITGQSRSEDIYFINENTGWVVRYSGPSYKTTNGGNTWTMQSSSIPESRSVGFFDSQTGILGSLSSNVLYRSTNGGFSYSLVANLPSPQPNGICGISIVDSISAYACGSYMGPGIVIKTTNKGANWTNAFYDTSKARSLVDCYFWSKDSGIAVGGYNTTGNFSGGSAVVIKTTDGGATWRRVHKTQRTQEWCWKISFISRQTGYVSIERESGMAYILKTTNNGDNWSEIQFLAYDEEGIGFLNESTGWIGGWTGPTYMTTNGGSNWQLAGWGTNLNRFRFLNDTLAYAVGDRVYKFSRGTSGISQISSSFPARFNLQQNFPNPFNPSTSIRFDVSEAGNYRLCVFDTQGKLVSELFSTRLSPGTYDAGFNAYELSSGVYFAELSGETQRQVIKIILMK